MAGSRYVRVILRPQIESPHSKHAERVDNNINTLLSRGVANSKHKHEEDGGDGPINHLALTVSNCLNMALALSGDICCFLLLPLPSGSSADPREM